MRPDVTEQLDGLREILERVVVPLVADPYPADVLDGVLATLELLVDAAPLVPTFLRWDSEGTVEVLRLAGVTAPAPPDDLLEPGALDAHHREVRRLLEDSMPLVLAHDDARAAAIAHIRERAARYPLATRPRGGFVAHPAR